MAKGGLVGLVRRAHPVLSATGVSGIALTVIGLVTDVAHHLAVDDPSLTVACCGPGFLGHIVTLAGMVLALCWVTGVAIATRKASLDERRS